MTDINLFSPLPLKASQVMAVTATTSVIALTSVGANYQANLDVYNQGGDLVLVKQQARVGSMNWNLTNRRLMFP